MAIALPYLLILVFYAILAVIYAQRCDRDEDRKLCQFIAVASIIVFYIFFGLRGYICTDWIMYREYYKDASWSDIFLLYSKKQSAVIHEPGFTLLMCLCKLISNELPTLVIALTAIDTLLLWRFLKRWNVRNIPFFIMLFLTFQGIPIMFNLFRNQVAIFIFLNLLEYIEDRKPIKYFIGCAAAVCFHSSAMLFFPLYFILNHKINKWGVLGVFVIFFVFYMSKISIITTAFDLMGLGGVFAAKAKTYTEMFSNAREFSITGTIEKFSLVALIFIYYDKLTIKRKNVIVINCALLYQFFYYMFAEFQMMSSRLSMLFAFSYWLLWIEIFGLIKIPNNKRIAAIMLFVFSMYQVAVTNDEPIQKYENFLFGVQSQEKRLRLREKTVDKI